MATVAKTFASTFLYSKYSAEKQLLDFIMKGEMIDKREEGFDDIKYDVKRRQISNSLVKVLESDNVVLIINEKPLPMAFKVFAAKDIKHDKKMKVFIDCTDVIVFSEGRYVCIDPDKFIAYLVSAMNTLIYYAEPNRIVSNSSLTSAGAYCFSSLFTHVVDYIYKISTVSNARAKCLYLSAMYYMANILGKDFDSEGTKAIAQRISGLSDREEDIIKYQLDSDSFLNIKFFIEKVSSILKLDKLTVDLVIEKWMWLYGPSTVFSLELYPCFATMITDAYVGCYINNQKTIEKITGKNMVEFTKNILRIGADSI